MNSEFQKKADQCGFRVKDLSLGDLSVDTQLDIFFSILFVIAKVLEYPRCPSTEELEEKKRYIYRVESYVAMNNDEEKCIELELLH